MAMRSQVYEWTNLAPTGSTSTLFRRSTDVPVALASGTQISVFIGGTGYNITKPAETTATQFVVIEDVALTPDGATHSNRRSLSSWKHCIVTVTYKLGRCDYSYAGVICPSAKRAGTITSSGSGTGGGNFNGTVHRRCNYACAAALVTSVAGSGFAAGDTITFGTAATSGGTTPVVITLTADDICVPQNGGHAQIRINTTNYFQNPDVTATKRCSGSCIPLPKRCQQHSKDL